MKRYASVDDYILGHEEWKEALIILRDIVRNTELEEVVKWGSPVYTLKGKNVIGLGAFKAYVGIWFFHGSFLSDELGKLINAQEGKTKGMRQWRFNSAEDIDPELVLAYVEEAIQNQKEGKEIKPERKKELIIPEELKTAFDQHKDVQEAFLNLTFGKQREYAEYIQEAKRQETKVKRIEKIIPMILNGVGLNDKYK